MKLGARGGLGLLVAATLFAAPAMGQQTGDEEEELDSALEDASDAVQDAADLVKDGSEKRLKQHPVQPSSQNRGTARPATASTSSAASAAEDSAQGLEALMPVEDDAAKAALQPAPSLRGTVKPWKGGGGVQGAEAAALGDEALHAMPMTSYGDDVAHGAGAAAFADDAARGVGAASFADDAARAAGGGLAKIGAALAALGALLAKLLGGKKDE